MAYIVLMQTVCNFTAADPNLSLMLMSSIRFPGCSCGDETKVIPEDITPIIAVYVYLAAEDVAHWCCVCVGMSVQYCTVQRRSAAKEHAAPSRSPPGA